MFVRDKKGQSALEYLMTYGWAVVVIAVVLVLLWFISTPTSSGQINCQGFTRLPIVNQQLTSDQLAVIVNNGTARALTGITADGTFTWGTYTESLSATAVTTLSPNDRLTLTFNPVGDMNGQIRGTLHVQYNDGDFTHDVNATCNGSL